MTGAAKERDRGRLGQGGLHSSVKFKKNQLLVIQINYEVFLHRVSQFLPLEVFLTHEHICYLLKKRKHALISQ